MRLLRTKLLALFSDYQSKPPTKINSHFLPFEKKMKNKIFLLLFISAYCLSAQSSLLQSGPMLGYSEMREVLLWVQTTEAAKVQFAYWPQGKPDQRKTTTSYQTKAIDAFTASIPAIHLEPGTHYDYQLLINGEAISLKYTTTFTT